VVKWAIAWACRATAFLSPAISLRTEGLTGSQAQNEIPPPVGAVVVVVVGMVEGGVVLGAVVDGGLVEGVVCWALTGWVVAGGLVGAVPLGGEVVVDEPGEDVAGDEPPEWDIGDVVEGDVVEDPVPAGEAGWSGVAACAGVNTWASAPFGWTANHTSSTPSPVALTRARSSAKK
jgi:hypothetical protein